MVAPNFVMIGGADPQHVPCKPTDFSNLGVDHKHLCECGVCWSHSSVNLGDEHAHTCPGCGAEVWHKHWNDFELALKAALEHPERSGF